jgi:hypothetical protein
MRRRSDDRDTDTVFDWLSVALRCALVVLVTAALQQFQFFREASKAAFANARMTRAIRRGLVCNVV